MIAIGTKVKIKEWDDMEREFGLDQSGDINMFPCFSPYMREYCGKLAEIVGREHQYYTLKFDGEVEDIFIFSEQMFSNVYDKEIRVGDWVRIKTWNELNRKFKRYANGHILCDGVGFVHSMKEYSGMIVQVEGIQGKLVYLGKNPVFIRKGGRVWSWSVGMVEKVESV